MSEGKIIVIDGSDGTGKATTTQLVVQLCNKRQLFGNLPVLTQSFPNYQTYYGQQIRAYLDGDNALELIRVPETLRLDPICASIPYAMDRYLTYEKLMKPKLKAGHWFICDRYTTSNMGHQGARIHTVSARIDFFDRLMRFENGYLGLPEPACIIILELPDEVRHARTEKRRQEAINKKTLNRRIGATDIHEQDLEYMQLVTTTYREMAANFNWPIVSGVKNNRELSPQEIAETVYQEILSHLFPLPQN